MQTIQIAGKITQKIDLFPKITVEKLNFVANYETLSEEFLILSKIFHAAWH